MPPQHMGQQQGSADGVHLCAGKFHCAISMGADRLVGRASEQP